MAVYKHDHTQLNSQNTAKTVDFYTKVMGAKVTRVRQMAGGQTTDLDLGGVPLIISGSSAADDKWQGLRYGLHHLGLTVDNIDKAAAELKANGVEFILEPTTVATGSRIAFIKAPDNVLIELIQKKE